MVYSHLTTKRYKNVDDFLEETEKHLEQQEIKNTFVLTMAQQTRKDEKNGTQLVYYCGTVWDDHKLLLVIFALDKSFLYASSLFDPNQPEALTVLVKDVLESHIEIQGIHGYQPILNQIKDIIESFQHIEFEKYISVWSYEIKQVKWSPLSLQIAKSKGTEVRLPTSNDLPLLKEWTEAFIQDCFKDPKMVEDSVDVICNNMITSKLLYLLCIDDDPVTMAWGVRPLHFGCSLAYVYTPPEHRQKGYGAACVSMCTEELLKKYSYVTLFVDYERNREDNLYTRVGYRYFEEAGRFTRRKTLNKLIN